MRLRRLTVSAFALCVAAALPAYGQQPPAADGDGKSADKQAPPPAKPAKKRRVQHNGPVRITADQVIYDRDLNTVTASGHVEIDQAGRVLLADTVSYNLKQDVIIAAGNVSVTEPTGEVSFSDYTELTGDMKDAVSQGIRVLMIDDSRLSAKSGHRIAGDRSILDKAIYTACKPCAEDPTKPPLWDLKAKEVIHNEVDHIIQYKDAWLEMGGVPVAYTPYMQHADPTVKRESGLLPPSVLNNNIIGSGLKIPYFQVIDPSQDVTLSPMLTSKNDAWLGVVDRYRSEDGEAKTVFSVADLSSEGYAGNPTIGWHVDAHGEFDLNEDWRAGYQIQRVSDLAYLPTFGYITPLPYLTTRPYLEDFGYRNYASIEGYTFQNLVPMMLPAGAAALRQAPVVFPLVNYNYVGDPGAYGGFWTFDTHGAAVTRGLGTDSRQINTVTAWNLPYTASDGEVYHLTASMRADGYNTNDLTPQDSKMVNATRLLPDLAVDWRYPFTKLGEHSSQTITPIVMVSASPYGGNSYRIPNEDSLDFELNDLNIFSPQPSTGYDRVVSGPRVAYGGEYTIVNRGAQSADFLLGQSYQLHPQYALPQGTGLDHNLSDIVGRAAVSPSTNVVFDYSFRVSESDLMLRRSEITASFGPRPLNLQTNYVFYDKLSPTSPFNAREQLSTTLTAQFSHYWSSQFYTTQNLGAGAVPLQTGFRVIYDDECFTVTADAGDRYTMLPIQLQTFSAGHYLMLSVIFKTLGQFPVDIF